jgi:hypothetical protein
MGHVRYSEAEHLLQRAAKKATQLVVDPKKAADKVSLAEAHRRLHKHRGKPLITLSQSFLGGLVGHDVDCDA